MSVAPSALISEIEAGRAPVVLDVRSRDEYVRGHVPGAIHVPFRRVRALASAIPATSDEPLIVYCGHGPRAWIAGVALRRIGFRRVLNLNGHWHGWQKAGLRTAIGSAPG